MLARGREQGNKRALASHSRLRYHKVMSNTHQHQENVQGSSVHRGRLAPSPTGLLHLGNIWSFLWAWLWARSAGGSLVLRMEDIDPQRSRADYAKAIEQDLHWLGLEWDEEIVYQSRRQEAYMTALETLREKNLLYPCYCTRKELRTLAGAPHVNDMGAPYPGTCAFLSAQACIEKEHSGRQASLRLRTHVVENQELVFNDAIYGKQVFHLGQIGGDFALRRSDGVIAYQLAVVVDDYAQGMSHIVRGCDILVSTPRQILLQKMLNFTQPHYAHVPLLLDDAGERLAKRHNALSIHALRNGGVQPQRILGLLAYLAGLSKELTPLHLHRLLQEFSFEKCIVLCQCQDIHVQKQHIDFLYAS